MRRYQGEDLAQGSRIAIIGNDTLGNYVVSTPLMTLLRSRHPGHKLDLYSGPITQDFWEVDNRVDFGLQTSDVLQLPASIRSAKRYGLVVNLEDEEWAAKLAGTLCSADSAVVGRCISLSTGEELPFADDEAGHLAGDRNWMSPDLMARYPSLLSTPFIGEILCRTAYFTGEIPQCHVPYRDVRISVPDILISTCASQREKLWTPSKWIDFARQFKQLGFSLGIIGASPDVQRRRWKGSEVEDQLVLDRYATDLRGSLTLPEVAGALIRSRVCVTLDSGILHVAGAVNTQTVGLYRYGYSTLWAPPFSSVFPIEPSEGESVASISSDQIIYGTLAALGQR